MNFIDTEAGYISMNHIVSVRLVYDKDPVKRYAVVEYHNGEDLLTTTAKYLKEADLNTDVVKANPGYYMLEPIHDDDEKVRDFMLNPIVAWRIDGDAPAAPICVDDTASAESILCANGQVIDPFNQTWESLEAYKEDYKTDG